MTAAGAQGCLWQPQGCLGLPLAATGYIGSLGHSPEARRFGTGRFFLSLTKTQKTLAALVSRQRSHNQRLLGNRTEL